MFDVALAILFFIFTAVVFGWLGFNQPSWSRSYTTAFRYWVALTVHVALYVGALLACALVLRKVFGIYGMDRQDLTVMSLWATFVIGTLVRTIPALVDGPRRLLHRAAGVPWVAVRQADRLADVPFARNTAIDDETRALLRNRGIDAECDWLPAATQVYEQLLNATALFIQLRDWEGERRYARFVSEARQEFDRLRQEFDRVSFRFARAVGNVERVGTIRYACSHRTASMPDEVDGHFRKLVKNMLSDIAEDVSVFYRDMCGLVSRGVLVTRSTKRARARAFARIGFQTPAQETQLGVGVLLNAAVLLYLGIGLFFQILPGDPDALPQHEKVLVITMIVLGSLAMAIVPKLHWGFANAGLRNRTPAWFVIGAGVAGVVWAVIVNLVAGAMFIGGLEGASQRLSDGAPYLHSAFVTAAVTAWLVQDHRWHSLSSRRTKRMLDAATLGGVWIVASMVAQYIRGSLALMDAQALGMMLGLAFVLGAAIGYAIPGSVRADPIGPAQAPPMKAPTNFALTPAAHRSEPAQSHG